MNEITIFCSQPMLSNTYAIWYWNRGFGEICHFIVKSFLGARWESCLYFFKTGSKLSRWNLPRNYYWVVVLSNLTIYIYIFFLDKYDFPKVLLSHSRIIGMFYFFPIELDFLVFVLIWFSFLVFFFLPNYMCFLWSLFLNFKDLF